MKAIFGVHVARDFRQVLYAGEVELEALLSGSGDQPIKALRTQALEIVTQTVARAVLGHTPALTRSRGRRDSIVFWPGILIRDPTTHQLERYLHPRVVCSACSQNGVVCKHEAAESIPVVGFDTFLGSMSDLWVSPPPTLHRKPSTHQWLVTAKPRLRSRGEGDIPLKTLFVVTSERQPRERDFSDVGALVIPLRSLGKNRPCLGGALGKVLDERVESKRRWPWWRGTTGRSVTDDDINHTRQLYDLWLAACFRPGMLGSELQEMHLELSANGKARVAQLLELIQRQRTQPRYRWWVSLGFGPVADIISPNLAESEELGSFMMMGTLNVGSTPGGIEMLHEVSSFVEGAFLRLRMLEDTALSRLLGAASTLGSATHDFRKWIDVLGYSLPVRELNGYRTADQVIGSSAGIEFDYWLPIPKVSYRLARLYYEGLAFLFRGSESTVLGFVDLMPLICRDQEDRGRDITLASWFALVQHCATSLIILGEAERLLLPQPTHSQARSRALSEAAERAFEEITHFCDRRGCIRNVPDGQEDIWQRSFRAVSENHTRHLVLLTRTAVRAVLNCLKHGAIDGEQPIATVNAEMLGDMVVFTFQNRVRDSLAEPLTPIERHRRLRATRDAFSALQHMEGQSEYVKIDARSQKRGILKIFVQSIFVASPPPRPTLSSAGGQVQ